MRIIRIDVRLVLDDNGVKVDATHPRLTLEQAYELLERLKQETENPPGTGSND